MNSCSIKSRVKIRSRGWSRHAFKIGEEVILDSRFGSETWNASNIAGTESYIVHEHEIVPLGLEILEIDDSETLPKLPYCG